MDRARSLYVHIPFCRSLCPYCDFTKSVYQKALSSLYLEALFKEAKVKLNDRYATIYIGGGTPTSLEEEELEELLRFLKPHLEEGGEWSVETNPETLTEGKVALLSKYGVNRVSIGVQSFSEHLLRLLGRRHREGDIANAIGLLKKYGIDNISLDWMYGINTETKEDIALDIRKFLSFDVPHLSTYSLIYEEGTPFKKLEGKALGDDAQQEQFELIKDALIKAGYRRYEVSSFSKPGYQCLHNLTYWKDERYVAIGLGASGYEGDVRYKNVSDLGRYLQGEYLEENETVGEESEIEDFLLTNLRLCEGFALETFKKRFGFSFRERFSSVIAKLQSRGLVAMDETSFRCSEKGIDFLDAVLRELFMAI